MSSISKQIFDGENAKEKLLYKINELLGVDIENSDDEYCYELSYDNYDCSVEIYLSPLCPLDLVVSQELKDYLIKECDFGVAYFNFINGLELHVTKGNSYQRMVDDNRYIRRYKSEYLGGEEYEFTEKQQNLIDAWTKNVNFNKSYI